jgi:hypothetical protein
MNDSTLKRWRLKRLHVGSPLIILRLISQPVRCGFLNFFFSGRSRLSTLVGYAEDFPKGLQKMQLNVAASIVVPVASRLPIAVPRPEIAPLAGAVPVP